MFKHDPLTSTTPQSQNILNDNQANQLVTSNLRTLLPAQYNATQIFEAKIQNRVLITGKSLSNTSNTANTNGDSFDDNDDDLYKSLFSKPNNKKLKKEQNLQFKLQSLDANFENPFFAKNKKLTSKIKKIKSLHKFPHSGLTYKSFIPALELFQSYLRELIGVHNTNVEVIEEKLLRIDLHGSPLTVVKSISPSVVGHYGIVIKETQNGLILLTPNDKIVTILKKGTIFQLDFSFLYKPSTTLIQHYEKQSGNGKNEDNLMKDERLNEIGLDQPQEALANANQPPPPPPPSAHVYALIYGDQIQFRPHERLTRKFKLNSTVELH
jgi:RNase P/RNase MRP subunit p29